MDEGEELEQLYEQLRRKVEPVYASPDDAAYEYIAEANLYADQILHGRRLLSLLKMRRRSVLFSLPGSVGFGVSFYGIGTSLGCSDRLSMGAAALAGFVVHSLLVLRQRHTALQEIRRLKTEAIAM